MMVDMSENLRSNAMRVKFKTWDCVVVYKKYGNGRTAIQFLSAENGELIATASINLVAEPMEADEIAIKNYAENESMLEVLESAGIVSEPIRFVITGYVVVPICKLLITGEAL